MTDRCARCNAPAYHVERVLAVGKTWHKSCLTCSAPDCNKRLDSHLLVEHDDQPYCKNCHLKLFGTRDLRHFNHPTASPSLPSSPAAASSPARPIIEQSYLKPRPPVPPKPNFGATRSVVPPPPAASDEKLVIEPARERSTASLAVMGGSPAGRGFGAGASRAGWRVEGGTEKCGGCGKTVYHAEQVIALDRKWHKGCLRCSVCNSTLPPSKVSDHDGQVVCGKCHAQHFGGGYALR